MSVGFRRLCKRKAIVFELIPFQKKSPTFVLFGLNFWLKSPTIILSFASVVVFSLALLKTSLVVAL